MKSSDQANWSLIIPTCNRPERLARCLALLPREVTVIVTDDSSDARTHAMLRRDFAHVRWTQGPRRGPAANRNHGTTLAGGEWLAFLDDDVVPSPGWLTAIIAAATSETDVIEGKTVCPNQTGHSLEEVVENLHGGNLWSCNFAIRAKAFRNLGGFDEDFLEAGGEDMEFAWRVKRAGLEVRFAPEALVSHPPRRLDWGALWRRTWMLRWVPLYRLKTGGARSIPQTVIGELRMLLGMTYRLFVNRHDGRLRKHGFAVAWRWLTLPVVLPYVLYWYARFRRKLRDSSP